MRSTRDQIGISVSALRLLVTVLTRLWLEGRLIALEGLCVVGGYICIEYLWLEYLWCEYSGGLSPVQAPR